jgi:hypothetical protein
MVEQLSDDLDSFPGAANQMCCFAHTLSISAKAILKQFDIPKGQAEEVLDGAAQAFADLAMDFDFEDRSSQGAQEMDEEEEDDEPLDSLVDFCEGLNEVELRELDVSIKPPVRTMLIKVC